jgi:hypothetical protein
MRGSTVSTIRQRNLLRILVKRVERHCKRYLDGVVTAPKWTADYEDEMKGGSI